MTPAPELDTVIHPPKRLKIMALLRNTKAVDFSFLRERLQIRDSDLSKQMRALSEAGYVRTSKRGRGPKSSTWFSATAAGHRAFDAHTSALRTLIAMENEFDGR